MKIRFIVRVAVIATLMCVTLFAAATTVTTTSLPVGIQNSPYNATVSAGGGTAPYTWRITACSGACNTGLAFSSAGVISGTPANVGTSTFTFAVTDATGSTASAKLNLTISTATTSALKVTTTSLPGAIKGSSYSATLGASGGTAPYSWKISSCSGACNTGLSFSSSGIISGTPTNTGTSTFTFVVTDAKAQTASAQLSLVVSGSTSTISLSINPTSVAISAKATQQFSATVSGTTTTAVSWSVNGVQGGNSTVGSISSSGLYTAPAVVPTGGSVSVTATSVADTTKRASATVTIMASPTVSVSVSPTSATIQSGSGKQFSASVTGASNTSVTWLVNGVVGGNSTVGTISSSGMYTAPAAVPSGGSATVTARSVYDSTKSASAAVTITAAPTSTVAVSVTPSAATLQTGQAQQFSATVTGTTSTGVSWQVNGVAGGNSSVGTISTSGLYTAPASVPSGGSVQVSAISTYDTTKSAMATVSINGSTPTSGHVYYVAPGGNDANACSQTAPCARPDFVANNRAVAGDTVNVAAGTYSYGSGAFNVTNSGSATGGYIQIVCTTPGSCKITNSVTGNQTVVQLAGSYLTLTGFEITNTGTGGAGGGGNNLGIYTRGNNLIINKNTIHHIEGDCGNNGGGGIQMTPGESNVTVDSNLIYDINWSGSGFNCKSGNVVQFDGVLAEVTPSGSGIVITNNTIYNIGGGWGIGANGMHTVIANNLIFNTADGGIQTSQQSCCTTTADTIVNNMILNVGQNLGYCGIYTVYSGDSSDLIANNNIFNAGGGAYCKHGTPTITGSMSVDPSLGTTFVNWQPTGGGNYHQKAGSPTIDSGTSQCAYGSTCATKHDFDGNPRPKGSGWDIGPYEY